MFGYIKPYKPELLVKELEAYKGVYCSLCRRLKKDYGFFASFILSYDCTFYAMLEMSLKNECPKFIHGRCRFNPLKRCNYCSGGEDALKTAAAVSVITFYYKLKDDIKDFSFIKSLPAFLLLPFASRYRKKALKLYGDVDDIVSEMLVNQFEAEKDKDCPADKASEPTAIMLAKLMRRLAKEEKDEKLFYHFGYYLGKWVYLIDAIDDIEKDIKQDSFNPFVNLIKNYNIASEKEKLKETLNGTLNYNVSKLSEAFNLMELTVFDSIIENIVLKGFAQTQKNIIFQKDNNKEE